MFTLFLAPGFNLRATLTWPCVWIFTASLLVKSFNYTNLPRVPVQSSIWMLLLQSACINNVGSRVELRWPTHTFGYIKYTFMDIRVSFRNELIHQGRKWWEEPQTLLIGGKQQLRLVWRGDERVTIKRLPSFFLDVVKHIAFTLINDKVFFSSVLWHMWDHRVFFSLARLCCLSVLNYTEINSRGEKLKIGNQPWH